MCTIRHIHQTLATHWQHYSYMVSVSLGMCVCMYIRRYVCACLQGHLLFIVPTQVYGPCWLVLWAYSCAPTAGVPDIVVCHLRIQVTDVQAQLAERLHMTFNTTSADDDKGLLHEVAQEEAAGGSEGGEGVTGVPSSVLPTACSPVRGGRSEAICPFSSVHWRCTEYPLAELCGETGTHIKGRGSFVVKMSAEGKIAAVMVNCRSAEACRVVYVSLESDRTISAPVYDCTQPGDTGRLVCVDVFVRTYVHCVLAPACICMLTHS